MLVIPQVSIASEMERCQPNLICIWSALRGLESREERIGGTACCFAEPQGLVYIDYKTWEGKKPLLEIR
jgi:hypothetical protein